MSPDASITMVTLPKDHIVDAIKVIRNGLEYAEMNLAEHDATLGRSTIKNRMWAERMEQDIQRMYRILVALKAYDIGAA